MLVPIVIGVALIVEACGGSSDEEVNTQETADERNLDQYLNACEPIAESLSGNVGCRVAIDKHSITHPNASQASVYIPQGDRYASSDLQELLRNDECLIDCTWPTTTSELGYTECYVRITTVLSASPHGYHILSAENLTLEQYPTYGLEEVPEECLTTYDE